MSGGSYNYLCRALDLEDLHTRRHDLADMAERLAGLGYAQDAARETEELLVLLRQWETRAQVRVKRLADVWEAVEWWDSSDRSEDAVHKALAKYREDHPTPPDGKVQPQADDEWRRAVEEVIGALGTNMRELFKRLSYPNRKSP